MTFLCGNRILCGASSLGRADCIVHFDDTPDHLYLLTARHVAVGPGARQNDPIRSSETSTPIGTLRTWSKYEGGVTVDAALIWIDPKEVSNRFHGLAGLLTNIAEVEDKMNVRLYKDGVFKTAQVIDTNFTTKATDSGSNSTIVYFGQIRTDKMISERGDSGAMVLDENDRIVGMVVAGDPSTGDVITPIGAILNYYGWNGTARLVGELPQTAASPFPDSASNGIVALPPSGGDESDIPSLIRIGNSIDGLSAARATATAAWPEFPHNGCAAHLSALLQQAGIAVPMTLGAGALAQCLSERGWVHVDVGKQCAGDVGVCYDKIAPPGADHIYLVLKTLDQDLMLIADNQRSTPHNRSASGIEDGKTPTAYFLRAE